MFYSKSVDKNGNYKLFTGYVFGNKNKCEIRDGLITMQIYMIMFIQRFTIVVKADYYVSKILSLMLF